jgi:hypothetical protein
MSKAITVTIPVTFEIKDLLDEFGAEYVNRKKFYAEAQSEGFKQAMAQLLKEDFFSNGGFDDLDLFEGSMKSWEELEDLTSI